MERPKSQGRSLSFLELSAMNDLLVEKLLVVGEVVEVTDGPLSGVRGVLFKIADDGRAIIGLDERQGVLLVISTENVAATHGSR
jgi:transcription antitermination factor NusG